jgi:hypothetical protein
MVCDHDRGNEAPRLVERVLLSGRGGVSSNSTYTVEEWGFVVPTKLVIDPSSTAGP